ncbi:hypothetical protein GCM10028803_46320 [Larkinella knui]
MKLTELDDASLISLRKETEKQKFQVEQIQLVREVYKRSVQRLYDFVLIILMAVIVSVLLWLATQPQQKVTVQIGIHSQSVDLLGVLPTWSMDGAEESDQILRTDKSISVANVDWLEHNHNKSQLGTADKKRFKLKSIDLNGRPSQLSLDGVSFIGSNAHLSLNIKNNSLNLSIGTDDQPINVEGTLCKNGCSGELNASGVRSDLDSTMSVNFGVEAEGKQRMELAFSGISRRDGTTGNNPLQFRWEDISLRDNIIFAQPISDTTERSTIEFGWIYILQTDDTIRLGKHDVLRMLLADTALASVGLLAKNDNLEAGNSIDLFTDAMCQVKELKISQKGFTRDLMPRQIEVMAEKKDKALLFAIVGLLATLFVPLIFRNRL